MLRYIFILITILYTSLYSIANELKNTKTIKVGVMLPLHNEDGDGRRMVEYYRGMLMAADTLKTKGISTEFYAWNVSIDVDIQTILNDPNAKKCNIIFGPLYSKQVSKLSNFCRINGIKLIIPFSITGGDVNNNPQIFQIYQNVDEINNSTISAFEKKFKGYHPIFIDCNDSTSKKGVFTFALRNKLERLGIKYNITNLKSSEEMFSKAFSRTEPNIVILNTGRSPELSVALSKLNSLTANFPNITISLLGYTEWLMYTKYNLENFYKYNTYIPSMYYYNPLSTNTQKFENNYIKAFSSSMQNYIPRMAITGYDHACFFIQGISKFGSSFVGNKTQNVYKFIQTPLNFRRIGEGGYQNTSFMLIHYLHDHNIEMIMY